jgi:hypothetical protein
MPVRIPNDIRDAVIRDWLNGKVRDTISRDHSLSAGAVTNIVNEWKNALSFPVADALRILGTILRKSGITASQCASGFRLASIVKELGVDEEAFRFFISDTYDHSKNIGLQPDKIAAIAKQILDLAESIPLSAIPDYIQEKTVEKRKLQEEITKLGDEELAARAKLEEVMKRTAISTADLKQFSDLKIELNKLGISLDDIPYFVKTMKGVKQLNYDVDFITTNLTNFNAFCAMQAELEKSVKSLTITKHDIEEECERLEEERSTNSQTIERVQELKKKGFGFKELKQLSYTIKEIAAANNIPESLAIKKFIADIDQQYDYKLGFELKVENLKSEILKNERDRQSYTIATTSLNSAIIQQQQYITQQNEQIKKNAVLGEFGPLIRAAKRENVPLNELKFALVRAIEVMLGELGPTIQPDLIEVLNSANLKLKDTMNDII